MESTKSIQDSGIVCLVYPFIGQSLHSFSRRPFGQKSADTAKGAGICDIRYGASLLGSPGFHYAVLGEGLSLELSPEDIPVACAKQFQTTENGEFQLRKGEFAFCGNGS
jgi:hypothetical protein